MTDANGGAGRFWQRGKEVDERQNQVSREAARGVADGGIAGKFTGLNGCDVAAQVLEKRTSHRK